MSLRPGREVIRQLATMLVGRPDLWRQGPGVTWLPSPRASERALCMGCLVSLLRSLESEREVVFDAINLIEHVVGMKIVPWNDSPQRTVFDVQRVLVAAAR